MSQVALGRGLNIGGWLSQSSLSPQHIAEFFKAEDARRIRDWGFDNIRLPFDYPLLESDDAPGVYSEEGFEWIDRGIEWAHASDLKVVLDMHKAPGFSFGQPDAALLLYDADCQHRFFALWHAITQRYKGIRENLCFELLNEIVAPDADQWNALAARAVQSIRGTDSTRVVVVGSNRWNSASTFDELAVMDDPNIVYTFHFYEPMTFTHQKAGWVPALAYHGLDTPYPGKPPELETRAAAAESEGKLSIAHELRGWAKAYEASAHDLTTLVENLSHVIAFREKYKVPVYCGEFGVIETAPRPDSLRWHRDMIELFRQHGIDWSLWSYKAMDFGVVDSSGQLVSSELLDILTR